MGYQKHHRQILDDPYYQQTVATLRQARETAGLSQLVVGKAIGVRWETVCAWECLRTLPTLFHFFEWCKVLGIVTKEKK